MDTDNDIQLQHDFEQLLKDIEHSKAFFDAKTGKTISELNRELDHEEKILDTVSSELKSEIIVGTKKIRDLIKNLNISISE